MPTQTNYCATWAAGLPEPVLGNTVDAALAWADSGLMFLCGELNQPPRQGPGAIPSCARGVINALRGLAPQTLSSDIDGARLLSERAAMLGLRARGPMSPNQSCRVLPSLDGWLALNLARRADWLSMAAWLQADRPIADWDSVHRAVAQRHSDELVERAADYWGCHLRLPASPPNLPSPGSGCSSAACNGRYLLQRPRRWWSICHHCGLARCAVTCYSRQVRG